jgi:Tol biopolymer transport system component
MDHTLQAGDGISHYRIVSPLGSGGMGEVYLAQDLTLERSVALKVLPPQLVRNEERLRRFVIEAKAASSLNHPSIVTIYEIGSGAIEHDGEATAPIHFIAMERIDGHTLAELIHTDKEDLRRLLGYLAQAADGIAKAHGAGIVHRDLKPSNIMVSRDGFAKVLDFGLAKLTEARTSDDSASVAPTRTGDGTGAGTVMGTVGYMSPEQVQGKSVDHRSDIFSFGCILYEAVTRKRAFEADSAVDTMHKILHDAPVETHELNPTAPADLRRLVRRCLAKSPDQRLQSMKDLAIELREIADGYDSLSNSASSGSGVSAVGAVPRPTARRSRLIGGIAVAVLCVAGLVGAYMVMSHRGPAGAGGGQGVPDMKMTVLMSRDDINEFVLSSDGRYLVYVTSAEEKTSLNVRQVRTGGDVRIVPPQEFTIRGISFSPDGDYVYYLNQDPVSPSYQALFQVPSLGGTPRKVFFDVDTAAGFSPDGSRLCFRRGMPNVKADTLVVGELQTGKDRELFRVALPENFASAPAWSPDGKRVAVSVQTTEGGFRTRISIIDVESGRREIIGSESFNFANSPAWLPDGKSLIVAASRGAEQASQIYLVSYPNGEIRRLTNDLNGYSGLSLASAGRSIAAMRRNDVSNVWVAPAEGGTEAHPITFATGTSGSSGEPLPLPGGDIVFNVTEGDKAHLWRATESGSERRQLVAQGLIHFGARYAEKAGIVFTLVADKAFIPHVWRVDADGGALRQLTDGKGEFFQALSTDGEIALFSKVDDPTTLWSLNPRMGGEAKRLASDTTGDGGSISPDGRLIRYLDFVVIQERINARSIIIPSGGGEPIAKFVLPPGAEASKWSPDSKSVTYTDRNKGWNLMRQPIAGGEPAQVTRFTEGVTTNFAWSPDGARIAVVRRIGPKSGLWSMQPGKGEPKLLAEFRSGAITDFRFTPDSKGVVFVYGTSSKDVVLISDFQ